MDKNQEKKSRPRYQSKPSGIIRQDTKCLECNQTFISNRSLIQHVQRGHK